MSSGDDPGAPLESLRTELHAALRADDHPATILAACRLLARPEIAPDDRLNVMRIRAQARRSHGHFAAAADDCTRVLEAAPADVKALQARGACHYGLGDYAAALADFEAADATAVPDASGLIWRGACRHGLGDVAGARADFRAANALEPDNAVAWGWRSAISNPDGDDLAESLAEVERVIAALPDAWSHRHRKAKILVALDRPGQALDELKIVLATAPDATEVRLLSARLREAVGDAEGALADLRTGLIHAPCDREVHQALIALLRRLERPAEALAAADAFARVAGEWAGVHALRGQILRELDRPAEAAEAFRAVLAIWPWDRESGMALAAALRAMGDAAGALEVLEILQQRYFTPDVARSQAGALHALGRPAKALKVLDRVIGADPRDVDALLLRAEIRQAVGRIKEAREDRSRAEALPRPGHTNSQADAWTRR